MRIRTIATPSLIGVVLLFAAWPVAAAPLLSISNLYCEDDYLCVDFYLKNAVDKDLLESMQNGIPALLRYRVDVWLDRANWYDKLVRSTSFAYRVNYDNWDTLYCVCTYRGDTEETINAGDVAELIHLVCNQQRMKICPFRELDLLASYYVTISAEIRSLSAERVREIDSWLGGADEPDESGGGFLGFVIGLFTSESKTAETKTNQFNLRGLGG